MVLAHEHPGKIVEHPPAPRPMMFWQSSLEHLAMWPPRHRRGCQSRLSARTDRHYLPPTRAPAHDQTFGFAAALAGLARISDASVSAPASVLRIKIASACPAVLLPM